ncbi:MAG: zinc ribbon domain-containing protein [Gammaproteobacteria bacterium]|nr:zinc ribbon domain-containing protein [Gammaproteobacteria bacterium]
MGYFLLWLLFGFASALVASSRGGRGFLYFIIGVIFGPFGLLFSFLAGPDKIECQFCKKTIREDATVCPHCQHELIEGPHETAKSLPKQSSPNDSDIRFCPMCAEEIKQAARICKHCKTDLV